MKRGLSAPPSQHFLNHQQWVKRDSNKGQHENPTNDDNDTDRDKTKLSQEAEAAAKKKKEEEEAMLDPAVRAARELAEKQRKIEAAKLNTRRMESADNAGRNLCLISKRTTFDIRMDLGQHMLTYPK
mmetsp:Transcript_54724/g.65842  ORF Transcript_54724/g.65842 Transcript_54724/m.65842 type:complete len:127 (-) Transcript_54724:146-526(-)